MSILYYLVILQYYVGLFMLGGLLTKLVKFNVFIKSLQSGCSYTFWILEIECERFCAGECTLNWPQRHKIALAIANGVAHLHLESLVHGNLKSSNVLVDGDLNALLTLYGLHLVVNPAATYNLVIDSDDQGYMHESHSLNP